MKPPDAFYTIGYEGATAAEFIAALKSAGVEILLDIREVPFSRKPGFSKTPLMAMLAEHGIDYLHLKGLGNPKPKDGVHSRSLERFAVHMQTAIAQEDLQHAKKIAIERKTCLLCFEREPSECHRNVVAPSLAAITGQSVKHLFPQKDMPLFPDLT